MPSEKSKYLFSRKHIPAPLEWKELAPSLVKLGAERLAQTIAMAAGYDKVILRVAYLQAVFASVRADDFEKMKSAVDFAMDITEHIPYNECDGYCQILYELQLFIEHLGQSNRSLALQLTDYVLENTDKVSEQLRDPAFWEMSCDDLRKLRAGLLQQTPGNGGQS